MLVSSQIGRPISGTFDDSHVDFVYSSLVLQRVPKKELVNAYVTNSCEYSGPAGPTMTLLVVFCDRSRRTGKDATAFEERSDGLATRFHRDTHA